MGCWWILKAFLAHCGVVLGVDLKARFAEALGEFRHCFYGDFLPIGTPQYLVAGAVGVRARKDRFGEDVSRWVCPLVICVTFTVQSAAPLMIPLGNCT